MENTLTEFEFEKFELNVLAIERTVIEKIASLIGMSFQEDLRELMGKNRYLYVIFMTNHLCSKLYEDYSVLSVMIAAVKESEAESRFKEYYPCKALWQNAPLFQS